MAPWSRTRLKKPGAGAAQIAEATWGKKSGAGAVAARKKKSGAGARAAKICRLPSPVNKNQAVPYHDLLLWLLFALRAPRFTLVRHFCNF